MIYKEFDVKFNTCSYMKSQSDNIVIYFRRSLINSDNMTDRNQFLLVLITNHFSGNISFSFEHMFVSRGF